MKLIVVGRQECPFLNSAYVEDVVFGYELDKYDQVIELMTEPILRTSLNEDANFTWYVFQDGYLLASNEIAKLVEEAKVKALQLEAKQQRQREEELAQKTAEAAKRQETNDRAYYERLKLRFEGETK